MATITHTETEEPANKKRWYDTGKYNGILLVGFLLTALAIAYLFDSRPVVDAVNATADAIVSTADKITADSEEAGN